MRGGEIRLFEGPWYSQPPSQRPSGGLACKGLGGWSDPPRSLKEEADRS